MAPPINLSQPRHFLCSTYYTLHVCYFHICLSIICFQQHLRQLLYPDMVRGRIWLPMEGGEGDLFSSRGESLDGMG